MTEVQYTPAGRLPPWREIYQGGSPEAEQEHFRQLAATIVDVQRENQQNSGAPVPRRTFHAKIVVGVDNAEVAVVDDLPAELTAGHFTPGAQLPVTVRLSNASGTVRSDSAPDLRGAALKIALPGGGEHDLLMTSYPVSHARNADQFVAVAQIGAGPPQEVQPRLLAEFGPAETRRIVDNLRQANRPSASLALESYWSRGAILWGDAGPVRFRLSPLSSTAPGSAPTAPSGDPGRLAEDFAARLSSAPVQFALHVQKYVSEQLTPIEDGAVEWKESDSPWLPVATLTIPVQNLLSAAGESARGRVDALAFNPWHAPAEFRPLGNLNRARHPVYTASARNWQAGNWQAGMVKLAQAVAADQPPHATSSP
jgi:hypothetical protein